MNGRVGKRHVVDRSVKVSEDVMVREGTRSDSSPSAPLPSLLSGGRSLPEPRGTCAVRAFSSQSQNSVSEYPNPRVPLVEVPNTLVHRHESLVLEMARLYVPSYPGTPETRDHDRCFVPPATEVPSGSIKEGLVPGLYV